VVQAALVLGVVRSSAATVDLSAAVIVGVHCNSILEVEVDGTVAAATTGLDSAEAGAAVVAEAPCNSIAEAGAVVVEMES
jgi:hypothetical protein